ncbi:MAG: hypothetical protein J0M04_17790 [Verrucomicrobia bacterium]|nr:hypothetical protein [Verrucomicrobiota bacterium]
MSRRWTVVLASAFLLLACVVALLRLKNNGDQRYAPSGNVVIAGVNGTPNVPKRAETRGAERKSAHINELGGEEGESGSRLLDLLIAKVDEARKNGGTDGVYLDIMREYWNKPDIYLSLVGKTAQGRETGYALVPFLNRAAQEKRRDYFAKAYARFPPGEFRTKIANALVWFDYNSDGLDAAILTAKACELPEERDVIEMKFRMSLLATGVAITPEIRRRLAEIKAPQNAH